MIDRANINTIWGSLIVEELRRLGVDYFIISPGSRSTPLTVAVARNARVRHLIAYDERGAAFHALGYARATGKPAALICTSGTATANYLPAIIEASQEGIPLIVLTADRPPELRETGANQTILQPGLYSHYVRWSFDLPAPDLHIPPTVVLTTVDQLWYRAVGHHPGPVHLNCMFREPLAPTPQKIPARYLRPLLQWETGEQPYTRYRPAPPVPSDDDIRQVKTALLRARRGLVVLGWTGHPNPNPALSKLITRLNWPVFADIRSGYRLAGNQWPIIFYFDQLLHSRPLQRKLRIDTILHIGRPVTSRRFLQWLEAYPPQQYIHVAAGPERQDPAHRITLRLQASIELFVDRLFQTEIPVRPSPILDWLKNHSQTIDQFLQKSLATDTLSEVAVARVIAERIPPEHALFVGNSMPIRDLDMFAPPAGKCLPVEGNRGASGIDGLIATATGYAAGARRPVTLLLGDLALIHDMNALALLVRLPHPIILVVINNHGGGIFQFLPIAQFPDVFERFFLTPHELTFQKLAEFFGLDYQKPTTPAAFEQAYTDALQSKNSCIIEVETQHTDYRQLQERVRQFIEQLEKER
ncbi:MAG: 2-succinyl-5-enolpyruvyl-6-hydroxy-3-cyclohexene-1-carboxylic-acid synthase [Calditrichaeota bacterium]|nr:2-succinyl-5-enolpyruvyl-6-hydroxy-3-cyclohexene-1-carboxylic-acid synthase [Calditrichota bacterium]